MTFQARVLSELGQYHFATIAIATESVENCVLHNIPYNIVGLLLCNCLLSQRAVKCARARSSSYFHAAHNMRALGHTHVSRHTNPTKPNANSNPNRKIRIMRKVFHGPMNQLTFTLAYQSVSRAGRRVEGGGRTFGKQQSSPRANVDTITT